MHPPPPLLRLPSFRPHQPRVMMQARPPAVSFSRRSRSARAPDHIPLRPAQRPAAPRQHPRPVQCMRACTITSARPQGCRRRNRMHTGRPLPVRPLTHAHVHFSLRGTSPVTSPVDPTSVNPRHERRRQRPPAPLHPCAVHRAHAFPFNPKFSSDLLVCYSRHCPHDGCARNSGHRGSAIAFPFAAVEVW